MPPAFVRSRFASMPVIGALFLAIAMPVFAAPPAAPAASTAATPAPSLEALLTPLTEDRLFTTATVAMQVVNVRTGEEVFARDADRMMVPASTMKIVTAATALKKLGPSYKFTTDFYADDDVKVRGDGTLPGNLYVQGHADPTMVVETLWKVVHDLKMLGIKKIDGNVVYDEGFLDTNYMIPGWDKQSDIDNGPSYFPPIGALSLNYNTVSLIVGPGEAVGKAARTEFETPAGDYVEIDNHIATTAAGTKRSMRIEREVTDDTPAKLKFTLTGTMPADDEATHTYRTVVDPTAHFMAAFREMLGSQGITITGKHVRGKTPTDGNLLLEHRSEPLTQILMDMNKSSNNFMAETVLRTVGAEMYGLPGTSEKGLKAVGEYLGTLGIKGTDYTAVNGSGLSRLTRLSPSQFTSLLLDMAHDSRVGHEFMASLAIAGRDGTLGRRLSDDPGRLRGKTGTIDGVHCLVGYLEAGDGEMYAFSFLVNDIRGDSSQVKRLQDKFARKMFTLGPTSTVEVVESGDDPGDEQAEP